MNQTAATANQTLEIIRSHKRCRATASEKAFTLRALAIISSLLALAWILTA